MSRLYDRIGSPIVDAVIVADNVTDYRAWHEIDNPSAYEDFPNIAPPFNSFYVEMRRSAKMPKWYPLTWGCLIDTFDPKKGYLMPPLRGLTKFDVIDESPDEWSDPVTLRWSQSEWAYAVHFVFEYRKGRILQGPSVLIAVRPDGKASPNVIWLWAGNATLHDDFRQAVTQAQIIDTQTTFGADGKGDPQSLEAKATRYLEMLLCAPLMAVCFMNCKNVELIDNLPPHALSKAYQKKTGQPLVTYKTIKINPMRTVKHNTDLDTTPAPHTSEPANLPLTIWRGHFKDFRDGKGLFGNPALRGVYWWDQHVRGSIDNGVTIKDYEVKAPKKD